MPAIAVALRKTGLDPRPSWSDRMRNRSPGSAISPAGSGFPIPLRKKPAAATARSRSDFRTRHRIAGRPALIVDDIVSSGGTMIACARALDVGRRDNDRRRRHARAVPGRTLPRHDPVRHSLDPLDTQRAALHQRHRARRSIHRRLARRNDVRNPSGDIPMSVTIRFCGAARTVTGSCYLFETPVRTLPGRLRSVSGTENPEGAELQAHFHFAPPTSTPCS